MNKYFRETSEVIQSIQVKHNTKKRCAIFATVQNESIFLPIWLSYYSKYFDGEDIYILDHRSEDGSIQECSKTFKFKHIRLNYPFSFDHIWFKFVAQTMQKKLLQHYEYVIFAEADEIIIPQPSKFNGLREYIDKLEKKQVRCTGYELIHIKDKESAFDPKKLILEQRNYYYRTGWFDKTLVSSVPLEWRIGFHSVTSDLYGIIHFLFPRIVKDNTRDDDLFLIHLHKLDFEFGWNRSCQRSKLNWKEKDIITKRGYQNRFTDKEKYTEFFYNHPKHLIIDEIQKSIKDSRLF